jgi:HAMP domain-containing protein
MRAFRLFVVVLVAMAVSAPAWAQAAVTESDLARLEATVQEIDKQVAALKPTDPTLAAEVETSLASLREEVTYLKVKLRREGVVTREEYAGLRDRLETLGVRARGDRVRATPVLDEPVSRAWTVPVGTEIDVRLQTPLSSKTAKAEDRFEATTILDFTMGRDVVIPSGSLTRGFVSSVRTAGRVDRRGSLTLSFDELRIDNTTMRLRASVTQALDGKVGEDATRIGAGAAVGAILGGLLGGAKGALAGILIGGGGTIAATDGSDVELPVGTILRIRIDQPLEIIVVK